MLSRARFLSSDRTTCHGAQGVSVALNIWALEPNSRSGGFSYIDRITARMDSKPVRSG